MPSLVPTLENDLDPEMIDNATNIAAEHLEDILSEDCKCESLHDYGRITCSVKVTHRLSFTQCKQPSKNVCFNTMQYALRTSCAVCVSRGLDSFNCYSIRPV